MEYNVKWEMFKSTSKNDEDFVDLISIDVKNKRYILDVDIEDWKTEGYDEEENDVYNTVDVSRFIFDLILKSLKELGFIELHY